MEATTADLFPKVVLTEGAHNNVRGATVHTLTDVTDRYVCPSHVRTMTRYPPDAMRHTRGITEHARLGLNIGGDAVVLIWRLMLSGSTPTTDADLRRALPISLG